MKLKENDYIFYINLTKLLAFSYSFSVFTYEENMLPPLLNLYRNGTDRSS